GPVERLAKWARRNPALAAVTAAALAALAVAGVLGYRSHLAEQRRLADRLAHQERLLAVQRQNALERALTAALGGDFVGAGKAIDEAEQLGASPGQIHFLRGQVAFHQGDVVAARDHLDEAVKEMPQNVAAQAMLAQACFYSGQSMRFQTLAPEVEGMTPQTPEDFLFKGQLQALALTHPEPALRTLDEALRRRD